MSLLKLKKIKAIILVSITLILNSKVEFYAINLFRHNADRGADITIVCYNVKCSDENYPENQIRIGQILLRESPDIVFLCEFHRSVSKSLDSIMIHKGNYKSYYRSKSNCIFYSKFDIDSIASIDTYTSSGKHAKNNIVHVFTPKGTLAIVGCHLSSSRKDFWQGIRNRAIEADSIFKRICTENNPVVVMGDLNDISGSYAVERIKEVGVKDAWWEGGAWLWLNFP